MEKALGAKLLDRHRRGVVPSPTGWLLVAHARAIVGQLARMRTELARCSDGLQSPLVVLANTSATQTLVPTALADFLATHSDVDVELQERPSHEIAGRDARRARNHRRHSGLGSTGVHDAAPRPPGRNRARQPSSRRPRPGGVQCVSGLPVPGIHPGKSAAGTPEWPNPAPRASPSLPGVSTHHRGDLCRGRSRCRNSGRPSLSRRPAVASRPARRRPDKRMGSPQSAALLPRPISIIGSCSTIQRTSGIGRLSDPSCSATASKGGLEAAPSGLDYTEMSS